MSSITNFFHLVKLRHMTRGAKFYMPVERPLILSQTDSFGEYAVDEFRAKYLPAAFDTLMDADELIEHPELDSATHVLCKNYGTGPSPWTVVMVKLQKGALVPVTSFACKQRKMRRWRHPDNGGNVVWSRT